MKIADASREYRFAMNNCSNAPISIFTPSFADADNTNAQNLTLKEIVARLPEDRFHVTMLHLGEPDERIRARRNTRLIRYHKHGNSLHLLFAIVFAKPSIYFYPRYGPFDRAVFALRQRLKFPLRIVNHVVSEMNQQTATAFIRRSVVESNAVFGNSSFVSQTVYECFGIKAQTIYNGIDRRFFYCTEESLAKRNNGPLTVLYAGSFQSHKRCEVVIRQASRFPDVQFRLAGKGKTLDGCKELAAQAGCRNVRFLGHLSGEKLGEEMRHAHVFLFPSILEGHPQVLGQAAACGVPAIAMNHYRPDYVVPGQTGFLADSDGELAGKLDLVLRNANLRRALSEAAARHAQKFDWAEIADQWASVFDSVVKHRN